jgi:hypothetical protein
VLRHQNPSGDLTSIVERSLSELLEREMKRRFAQTASQSGAWLASKLVPDRTPATRALVPEQTRAARAVAPVRSMGI